jgi:hypothetical protein
VICKNKGVVEVARSECDVPHDAIVGFRHTKKNRVLLEKLHFFLSITFLQPLKTVVFYFFFLLLEMLLGFKM